MTVTTIGIATTATQPSGTPAPPPPAPPPSPPAQSTASSPSYSFSSPVEAATSVAALQAADNAPSGSISILLNTQNAAGVGPAQFRVLVDGKDVTGVISSETAQYTQGQEQVLTINGNFANAQSVDIQTVGGSGLDVKQIAVGGKTYQAIDAEFSRTYGGVTQPFQAGTGAEALDWQGVLHFQTSAGAPSAQPPVTFSAPGAAPTTPPAPGQGLQLTFSSINNAEFRILVNGQDVTGRISGTVQNGQTQTVTVAGNFASASTVDVQFLNSLDGYYTNAPVELNVQSLSINGQTLQAQNAEFTRAYAGQTPTFTPGTGRTAIYWNGTLRFTPTPAKVAPPPPPPPPSNVLTVGAGELYATLAAAAAASKNGDIIEIKAGTYLNQAVNLNTNVTITTLGGPVIFTGNQNISNHKAYLVVNGNVTVDGITFENATVSSADGGNGAGIRFESGNLVVKNSSFIGNQDGILTTGDANSTLTVDSSNFINDGASSGPSAGFTHAIYAGTLKSVAVTNSNFEGTNAGHDIKSRAAQSTITGNTFDDNATASYSIDLPNGGNAVVENNVFAKAATADNAPAIHYGGEVANPVGSLLIQNNLFVNQRANGVVVLNQANGLTVNLVGNTIYGESAVASGFTATVKQSANTVAAKPPAKLVLPAGYNEASSQVFKDLLSSFHLTA